MSLVSNSLMRSLDTAVRAGLPTLLTIDGLGTVSVYPRQHCYVSDVQDWTSVYGAGCEQIRISPATWSAPPAGALPLEELQWRLALHDAQREGPAAAGSGLLHLESWPNLTRLPEELLEPVTRICALLWRKPTVSFLVARVLGLPPDQCTHVLRALQMFGHVSSPMPAGELLSGSCPDTQPDEAAMASTASTPESIVSKLWQRLTRLQMA
jgi:hypothetical protein